MLSSTSFIPNPALEPVLDFYLFPFSSSPFRHLASGRRLQNGCLLKRGLSQLCRLVLRHQREDGALGVLGLLWTFFIPGVCCALNRG